MTTKTQNYEERERQIVMRVTALLHFRIDCDPPHSGGTEELEATGMIVRSTSAAACADYELTALGRIYADVLAAVGEKLL